MPLRVLVEVYFEVQLKSFFLKSYLFARTPERIPERIPERTPRSNHLLYSSTRVFYFQLTNPSSYPVCLFSSATSPRPSSEQCVQPPNQPANSLFKLRLDLMITPYKCTHLAGATRSTADHLRAHSRLAVHPTCSTSDLQHTRNLPAHPRDQAAASKPLQLQSDS